jgi:signal transduction histidine kinase
VLLVDPVEAEEVGVRIAKSPAPGAPHATISDVTTRDDPDQTRVEAIDRYELLDAPPRRELSALVELAAKFSGVPMATINLITDAEQVQVATYGFTGSRVPRAHSYCTTVVEEGRPIFLEDARLDERFVANPHTTGELAAIRFYGAHPLVTPEGVTIGTLCVYDEETHLVTPQVESAMHTLADRVVDVLELELTSRQLAAANERLGAFAGQISHDLRNPLSAVRMSLEFAREIVEGGSGDAALVGLLGRAERSTQRMDDMIGELLTFARVGANLDPVHVDLATVVRDALEDLARESATRPIQVHDLPVVRGDAVQLRVLLQNLLANAMKFSPPTSPVTVAATASHGGWRITVSDCGAGVPRADRERVFEPMVRLGTDVPGSGIGLATCRRIVEAHGGRIGIDENHGGGAVVWFELTADASSS